MKKSNLIFLVAAWMVFNMTACEKEVTTENDAADADIELLKSVADDASLDVPPDILVTDSVLLDHASISQCREHLLAYTYDSWNRLDAISYIRRNAVTNNLYSNRFPGYIHMRDKFTYGNDGRISQLVRYKVSDKPRVCRLQLTKSFKYNDLGQLIEIVTHRPDITNTWSKYEYLTYDNRGNMVKKVVKTGRLYTLFFEYEYDRSDRLVIIKGYRLVNAVTNASEAANRIPKFKCEIHYDVFNNIERKDFYYPIPYAASITDLTHKWSVYYKYDKGHNPFFDMKLPVSSLFDWMDVISPSNISGIYLDNGTINRSVFYAYKYNDLMYPVLRYRTNVAVE